MHKCWTRRGSGEEGAKGERGDKKAGGRGGKEEREGESRREKMGGGSEREGASRRPYVSCSSAIAHGPFLLSDVTTLSSRDGGVQVIE